MTRKQKLYKLHYILRFESGFSVHSVDGIVGFSVTEKSIHVQFDDTCPMAGMEFDIDGELVEIKMVEE